MKLRTKTKIKLQTKCFFTLSLILIIVFGFQANSETIIFENINVIPMDRERVLYDQRVIVVDDKITAIESVSAKLLIKPDRTIACEGRFMIPGFSDTHYHQRIKKEDHQLLYNLLIANGITSVRNMMEDSDQDSIAIREYANKKSVLYVAQIL